MLTRGGCLAPEQEQKAKQRAKEYERKRDEKARDRQMYILRHTRDYETLELPLGAARADVKAAYRRARTMLWQPYLPSTGSPERVDHNRLGMLPGCDKALV
jgi:hypothetical protein